MNLILVRIVAVALMSCVFARSLSAQSSLKTNPQQPQHAGPAPSSPPDANPSASPAPEKPPAPDLPEPPKRMFGMIPDFENTNDTAANRHPLTAREKYILSLHQAFDVSAHIGNAFQAALQQAGDGQPNYGESWAAYGKRFAANEGDQISGSILIYGVLPSILHEDPRYFRQGGGSTITRMWYAVSRTFVTRRDSGTSGFNTSETLGQLMSSSISIGYYPQQDRSASRVFSNWAVNLGGNSAYNMLSEYYPDMMRSLFQRHKKPVALDKVPSRSLRTED